MKTLLQDWRYGVRMMLKSPGFTSVALLTLALGIGANAAIFSIVYSVLLKSLPYKDPERIVSIDKEDFANGFPDNTTAHEYLDWVDQSKSFEQIAGYARGNFTLTGMGEPELISGAQVTASIFPLLGIQPLQGRLFTPEEDRPGHNQVVVISRGFWQRRFGSNPNLLGRNITVNDKSYTIIGITPDHFRTPSAEIWIPLAPDRNAEKLLAEKRGSSMTLFATIGRLKKEATIEQARAELDAISKRTLETSPVGFPLYNIVVVPLREQMVGNFRSTILILFGAVGFVLLIACANVANLMLARATKRRKEMAIRTAVGANRWRLFRQLLTESALLGLVGGLLGILIAFWSINPVVSLISEQLNNTIYGLEDISVNKYVLLFTLVVSILSGIIFGLAPALVASQTNVSEALNAGTWKQGIGFGWRSLRHWLVVIELSLAFVLLVGAGLMVRSFTQMLKVNPGFKTENVLAMRIELLPFRYSEPSKITNFYQRVLERAAELEGVQSVGAINHYPLTFFGMRATYRVEDVPPTDEDKSRMIPVGVVAADYFHAMGIPLQSGRLFDERDDANGPPVALVNQAFARRFFPNKDPLGKHIEWNCNGRDFCRTIVGVVGDIKQESLIADVSPEIYVPYKQYPFNGMTLIIKTRKDPSTMVGTLREQVFAEDRNQPVTYAETLEESLKKSVSQTRALMLLFAAFAGLALLLAGLGVYGVMSYVVTQRRHEIGIRMALGADKRNILNLVMKQGVWLTFTGVGIGLLVSVLLTRLLKKLLFGVNAIDTLTFVSIALLLTIAALLACYIPARKAAKVDPINALRYD